MGIHPDIRPAERPRGGVVVMPDARGLEPGLEPWVARLHRAGWSVALLDPWSSTGGPPEAPDPWEAAWAAIADLEVIADAGAARLQLPAALPRFVLGFGAGGLHARLCACIAGAGWTGAVEFHGRIVHGTLGPSRPAQPLDLLPGLGCPILSHFGETDPRVPIGHVERLREGLERQRATALVHRYPNAGARFMFEDGAPGREAAALAWARTEAFLDHLAGAAA